MSALISFLASSHFKVRRGSKVFWGCAKEQIVVGKKVFLICYAELLSFLGFGLTHFPYDIKGEGGYHPNNKLLTPASTACVFGWRVTLFCVSSPVPFSEPGSVLLEGLTMGRREASDIAHVGAGLLRLQDSCWCERSGHPVRNKSDLLPLPPLFLFLYLRGGKENEWGVKEEEKLLILNFINLPCQQGFAGKESSTSFLWDGWKR